MCVRVITDRLWDCVRCLKNDIIRRSLHYSDTALSLEAYLKRPKTKGPLHVFNH